MVAQRRDDGHESAEHVATTHDCPDCRHRSNLTVRWNGQAGRYEAWCPRCRRTDGFHRRESLSAKWQRDPESVPVQIANKLSNKYGVEPMTEQALVVANERQMAERIQQARWLTELKPQDHQALAHLSVKYGLDPLMKELTLYEGSPYIMVAGLIRIAHRQKTFAGLEDRPMTQAERQQYGYKAPFCWIVKVHRSDWKVPAVGTGTGDPNAPLRNNPVERVRPEWLARARALRQALKLAYPHSLPFEEMASAEEAGIDPVSGTVIDHETGEIIGGPTPGNGNGHQAPPDFLEGTVSEAEPDLPFDETDAPEPTPAEEDADARAESERADIIAWLKTEYAPTKDKWTRLERWWGSHYPDTPETADLDTLKKAYGLLTQPKGK